MTVAVPPVEQIAIYIVCRNRFPAAATCPSLSEKRRRTTGSSCDCINELGSEFFGQSWFSRRWVIQEAMLARAAVIHWGSHTIALEVITSYVRRMNAFQMSRVDYYRANYNKTMAAALGNPLKTTDLLEHLWNFHEAECRDKEDRIAALHGLCPYGRFQLDYKRGWKEIYKQVASSALRSANRDTRIYVLLYLFEFGAVRWPNDFDFPSWVPDWSKKRKRPLPYIMYSKYGKLEAYPSWLGLDKASLVICGDVLRIHPCPAPGPTGAWRVVYVTSPSMDRYDPDHALEILDHLIPARARGSPSAILALASLTYYILGFRREKRWQKSEAFDKYENHILKGLLKWRASRSSTRTHGIYKEVLGALRRLGDLLQKFCLFDLRPADGQASGDTRLLGFGPKGISLSDIMIPIWRFQIIVPENYDGYRFGHITIITMAVLRYNDEHPRQPGAINQGWEEVGKRQARIIGPAVRVEPKGRTGTFHFQWGLEFNRASKVKQWLWRATELFPPEKFSICWCQEHFLDVSYIGILN
ncbi:uncharacterized protein PG986_000131 [Apiospora aurea]|uniref:Heterokaryon incompatibility domain-containing protein n=1 Tax=Apiospora aurea TaxID=335848 RepID=A0ABR1QT46_9PEZI